MLRVYDSNGSIKESHSIVSATKPDKKVNVSGPVGDAKLDTQDQEVVTILYDLLESAKNVEQLLTLFMENLR